MKPISDNDRWLAFIEKQGLHGLVRVPYEVFDGVADKDLRLTLINAKQINEGLLKMLGLIDD